MFVLIRTRGVRGAGTKFYVLGLGDKVETTDQGAAAYFGMPWMVEITVLSFHNT